MDLKHIEELAEDKDIMYAYMVSCFKCFYADVKDYECEEDIPKTWNELTEEEKADLIGSAEYFYFKDCSGASLGRICDLVIEHQKEVFADTLTKSEFFELLADYGTDY